MQHTHDRRVSGVRRVPVERLVDVCGAADPASAFQGRSVDISCRGMQVRASHLPQLHAPIVLRFHEHGAEVLAEGEVAWRRTVTNGGEFGVRFTALDSRSVQTLKALCGVSGLEEHDGHTQPGGAVAPIHTRSSSMGRELDHDTDPAPPAALGVRLHVAGLGTPLQARVKAQVSNRLELGSQLDFLRVGRPLDVEDLAYGGRRTAYVEALDVHVDPKSRVPELVVSVRYADAPLTSARSADAARSGSDAARVGSSRSYTPEPQRARSLARGRASWEADMPSSTPPPTTPRPALERGRTLAAPELDLSKERELAGDSEEERDTTPPPLPMRVDRAERSASSSRSASTTDAKRGEAARSDSQRGDSQRSDSQRGDSQRSDSQRGDSQRSAAERAEAKRSDASADASKASGEGAAQDSALAKPKASVETVEEDDESELDSTEAILARLDSLLRGVPDAARAAGAQMARWGGAASRGAEWCLARARRAVSASRRPAAPRRRTAAAPRSPLRSGSLRPSSTKPRTEDVVAAVRRRGTRTVLWSCLIALVAIGIGYLARPSRQAPVAARVAPGSAPALAAPAAAAASSEGAVSASSSVPLARASAQSPLSDSAGPPPAALLRGPSASVAEDEGSALSASSGPASKNALPDEGPSAARGQSVAPGSQEFGQGRLHLPVIYRLRLDEAGGSLRGERTATGFEITILGRRVLDSASSIAKRDSRIAKVSTQHGPQGTRVSFRFRDEIPAYKVRLRRDAVEFLISSS